MTSSQDKRANPKRALLKAVAVLAVIAVVVALLSYFVTDQQLDQLKHHLDLGTIVILLVIINLVSFACFLVLSLAYQWIRHDLKPPRNKGFTPPENKE